MITYLATQHHQGHFAYVAEQLGPSIVRVVSYDTLLSQSAVSPDTYIFGDMDRLGPWTLELAARYFRAIAKAGLPVMNDPAKVLHRSALLRRLHAAGINSFAVWRPVDGERPDRFPVFLRTDAAHRGRLTDLLADTEAVEAAIAQALAEGYALRDLLVVEYRAQANVTGAFRKYAAYWVAGRILPAPFVTDTDWHSKNGTLGAATEDDYLYEQQYHREMPHADVLAEACRIGGIDFGRLDYAVVAGRPEIYEINSNPHIRPLREHPSAVRLQSAAASMEVLLAAIRSLDTQRGHAETALELALPKKAIASAQRVQASRWVP